MDKTQLFCIPYAGGSASFFSNLSKLLGDSLEVHALEYAGHGLRRREPFYENVSQLVRETAAQIKDRRNLEVPYLIFGYSMGSMVTYEAVTEYLLEDSPKHVFLAAHEPPHLSFRGKAYALLDDEEFIKAVENFGGFDERIKSDQRFRDIFLPPMRADYRYLQEYRWKEGHDILPCDITVFYSSEDTRREDMLQWQQHTVGTMELKRFSGNHFFLKKHEEEIADIIRKCGMLLEE